MPRTLIFIPRSQSRLVGATAIDPAYAKGYSPEQMRGWAHDVSRLQATSAADLAAWRSLPRDQLTPEQQRVVDANRQLMVEHESGINGVLGDDGRVELESGRHRANYLMEQGVDPVPVWVWSRDPATLDDFRQQCDAEAARSHVASQGRENPAVRPTRDATERPPRPLDRGSSRDLNERGDRARP